MQDTTHRMMNFRVTTKPMWQEVQKAGQLSDRIGTTAYKYVWRRREVQDYGEGQSSLIILPI
jgi:hypothetical protein